MTAITVFHLILDIMPILTSGATFSNVSMSFILNAFLLIDVMLPGSRARL